MEKWRSEDLFLFFNANLHLALHPRPAGHPAAHNFSPHPVILSHRCITPPICPPNLSSNFPSLLQLLTSHSPSLFVLLLVFLIIHIVCKERCGKNTLVTKACKSKRTKKEQGKQKTLVQTGPCWATYVNRQHADPLAQLNSFHFHLSPPSSSLWLSY